MPLTSNQDYVQLMMDRLGSRNEAALRTRVVQEYNVSKDEIENGAFLPWFLEAQTVLPFTQGTIRYALPSTFLREIEGRMLTATRASDGLVFKMLKRTPEALDNLNLNATTDDESIPLRYAIEGTSLRIWPTPAEDFNITLPHYTRTDEITDATGALNPWFQYAPNYLVGLTGAFLAEFAVHNSRLTSSFNSLAGRAKVELIAADEARRSTSYDYSDSDALVEEDN